MSARPTTALVPSPEIGRTIVPARENIRRKSKESIPHRNMDSHSKHADRLVDTPGGRADGRVRNGTVHSWLACVVSTTSANRAEVADGIAIAAQAAIARLIASPFKSANIFGLLPSRLAQYVTASGQCFHAGPKVSVTRQSLTYPAEPRDPARRLIP